MEITYTAVGVAFSIWFLISMPIIVHLARKKSRNPALTMFWGLLATLILPLGPIFLYLLSIRPDLIKQQQEVGGC
jgi:hypothetical protein